MRTRARAVIEIAAAILLGAVLARLAAGPLRFELFDATLSVRAWWRPLLAVAVLLIIRTTIDRAPERLRSIASAGARVLLGGVIAASVLGWLSFLSTTCGGADSYGYVSAAYRLLNGTLVQDEPMARLLPFADGISAATPLGYTPSTQVVNASVPVYPLGLPAVMALAATIAGAIGPFVVAPMMGLVLLGAVYTTAFALSRERLVALGATALTAAHPVVFTYAIQPMSDVPAAASFLVAIAALVRERPHPFAAGCAAVLCLLIRPALAPALALLVFIPSWRSGRIDWHRSALFAIPFASGVALQLGVQWHLYGHPLANGYADMGTLFSTARLWVNVQSHAYWAWRALGPIFIGAAAIGLGVGSRTTAVLVALVLAGVAGPYLVYRTFDHWETLRFLLPALVLLTIPASLGLFGLSRRVAGDRGGLMMAAALVAVTAFGWSSWLREQQVFVMPEQETRYRVAGELVSQTTPDTAVILAALHSGSIRYYSHRQSVNWERVPSGTLATTVEAIQRAGHPVYLLFDSDQERASFEILHGSTAQWLPNGQRRNIQLLQASSQAGQANR